MRQKRDFQRGFSLIELLIVLAITALMIGIPVKMLTQGDQRTMLQQHVREVVAELYRIRNVAATLNQPMRLNIDVNPDNENYYLVSVDFFDFTTNDWKPTPKTTSKPKIDLARGYLQSITEDSNDIDFPLQFPFNANGIQLSNVDDSPVLRTRSVVFSNQKVGGKMITLILNPLGGIRVKDNY